MRRKKPNKLTPSSGKAQEPEIVISISLRELCEQRERFIIDPEYQRQSTWTLDEMRRLIESIFQGHVIGMFKAVKVIREGKTYYEIVDGQNRIAAILAFYDCIYKTWSIAQKALSVPLDESEPVQPSCFFEKLEDTVRETWLDYHIYINLLPSTLTEKEKAVRFLNTNVCRPLTKAEILNVYPSQAKWVAKNAGRHEFWRDFYIGDYNRGQIYHSCLYILALELTPGGMLDLRQDTYTAPLAYGEYDKQVTEQVYNTVLHRLDDMCCLYSGMQFTERSAVIPMYQSVMFLEQMGRHCNPAKDNGKLRIWMENILMASKRTTGVAAFHRPIQSLVYKRNQEQFWDLRMKEIKTLLGVKAA